MHYILAPYVYSTRSKYLLHTTHIAITIEQQCNCMIEIHNETMENPSCFAIISAEISHL